MFIIQNNLLQITINPKGAELSSIYHKQYEMEFLWSADPAFWAKKSPVLFPIIGTLKHNQYEYKGQTYELGRHGFAREMMFSVSEQAGDSITFSIASGEKTMAVFPFPFVFSIRYSLNNSQLLVTYEVKNTGEDEMYFSVGGHPAFKLPLVEGTVYEDYLLEFNKTENAGRWPINKDGLIETQPLPLLENTNLLRLRKAIFNKDALVIKHLQSNDVKLISDKTNHGLRFTFDGFPYLGLWAAPGADFICIEPWCGIADSADTIGEWPGKEGLNPLAAGETFERTWGVSLF